METKPVLLMGCSTGGKSTLLDALVARGMQTVPEPGRRIVSEERSTGGRALPWVDEVAFARCALAMASADLRAVLRSGGPGGHVMFDCGTLDAALALEFFTGLPAEESLTGQPRHAETVLVAPPWPELFTKDGSRRHGLAEAEAEYRRIVQGLPRLDYRALYLPKLSVEDRTRWVLEALDEM
ncbi:MAG: AAA family ATPase [Pseudomonadota bacterium]